MPVITLSGYYLTLEGVRTRVKSVLKEDNDIDDLVDMRINDATQLICRELLPNSLLVPPKEYTWTAATAESTVTLPDRTMRIASITDLSEDRRVVVETTPTELLQRFRSGDMETRNPYYFAQVGRNYDPSFTSITVTTPKDRSIIFDSLFTSQDFEVLLYVEHPLLVQDEAPILLDPPFHSLVVDGALLELAEYTGESIGDFEKKLRRFELRLKRAKKRINDEFAMPVVKGSMNYPHEVDRIQTIPRALGPRFP